jgi:hypothetical protein
MLLDANHLTAPKEDGQALLKMPHDIGYINAQLRLVMSHQNIVCTTFQ